MPIINNPAKNVEAWLLILERTQCSYRLRSFQSNQPMLLEGVILVMTYDYMVQHRYTEHFAAFDECLCKINILSAGRRITRRMAMSNYCSRAAALYQQIKYFSRVSQLMNLTLLSK